MNVPTVCPGHGCGPHPLSAVNPHDAEVRRRRREADALRARLRAAQKSLREGRG